MTESMLRAIGGAAVAAVGFWTVTRIIPRRSRAWWRELAVTLRDVIAIGLVGVGLYAVVFAVVGGRMTFPIWWEPFQVFVLAFTIGAAAGRVYVGIRGAAHGLGREEGRLD